jgi:hypothetical protein
MQRKKRHPRNEVPQVRVPAPPAEEQGTQGLIFQAE